MNQPLTPQERQELAAGYVLGDLSSSEAEQFQQLLAEDPTLQAEMNALQETLAMVPYGLDEQLPRPQVRANILNAAFDSLDTSSFLQRSPDPSNAPFLSSKRSLRAWFTPRYATAVAASVMLLLGLGTWQLGHQSRILQRNGGDQAQSNQPHVKDDWSGVIQLAQDHRRSLSREEGPVDVAVTQPGELLNQLKPAFKASLTAMPLLPASMSGKLVGGSNCQLGETQGVRLTYQLDNNQTLSVYQLNVVDDTFPEFQTASPFQSSYLTLKQPDGVSIVLWREEAYLYALVAEVPAERLQMLAGQI